MGVEVPVGGDVEVELGVGVGGQIEREGGDNMKMRNRIARGGRGENLKELAGDKGLCGHGGGDGRKKGGLRGGGMVELTFV